MTYKNDCVCHNNGDCSPEEFHCHFYCEKCSRTFCLEELQTPTVTIPEANYLLKGICAECEK